MAKKNNKTQAEISEQTKEMNAKFERLYTSFIEGADADSIMEELDDVENIKFVEYATWIPLRALIMLKSHLGGDETLQLECRRRVAAVTNSGTDDQIEAFQMMLEGEITGADLLAMAKESGDVEWERSLSLKIIAQLITIVEMGASRKFGYAVAVKALEKNLQEVRKRW